MAKYGPAAIALSFPEQIKALVGMVDLVTVLAIMFGLLAGVVWRAGDQHAKGEAWAEIKRGLIVSCLIGLGNFIIAAIVVDIAGVPPLYAIGIAMVIAAKGPDAMKWFAERYMPGHPPRR